MEYLNLVMYNRFWHLLLLTLFCNCKNLNAPHQPKKESKSFSMTGSDRESGFPLNENKSQKPKKNLKKPQDIITRNSNEDNIESKEETKPKLIPEITKNTPANEVPKDINYTNDIIKDKNDKKYEIGFNVYMKCSSCGYKQWVKFGCGSFGMSRVECETGCSNCKKEEVVMIILSLVGVGPAKFKYHFVCRDKNNEPTVEKEEGTIGNDKRNFDFLLEYKSYSYGIFEFSKI